MTTDVLSLLIGFCDEDGRTLPRERSRRPRAWRRRLGARFETRYTGLSTSSSESDACITAQVEYMGPGLAGGD